MGVGGLFRDGVVHHGGGVRENGVSVGLGVGHVSLADNRASAGHVFHDNLFVIEVLRRHVRDQTAGEVNRTAGGERGR